VPKATPQPVVDRLAALCVAANSDPKVKEVLATFVLEPAIGFNRLAGTGEFGTMFSHSGFSLQVAAIDFLQELQHAQRPRVDDAVIQRLRRAPEFNQPVGAQFCKVL